MSSNRKLQSRIKLEMQWLNEDINCNCTASPINDNIQEWEATIIGASETPYEGGVFKFNLSLPDNYPFSPPKVEVLTKIYHPNINGKEICLDTIKDKWNPVMNIQKLLLSISSLLADPNPESPLNVGAARKYTSNLTLYNKTVREWTSKYAK